MLNRTRVEIVSVKSEIDYTCLGEKKRERERKRKIKVLVFVQIYTFIVKRRLEPTHIPTVKITADVKSR